MLDLTRTSRASVLALMFGGAPFAAHATSLIQSANLLAHRAVYDLSMQSADDSSSAPAAARGRIVYEFTGSACEGWVTNFRQVTELQMSEGGERVSDLRSSTFEEGDGTSFAFKTDTFINGKQLDAVDGRARRADDDAIAVKLTKPKPASAQLAAGAVFPTAQIIQIMQAAKAGQKTAQIKIFDGSDSGDKEFDTMAVIGRPKTSDTPELAASKASDALKGVSRWPVSVSYFDPSKRDGEPNYVLDFDLFENGVSSSLRIDYGSYVLAGKMVQFEPLAQKACN